MKLSEAIRAGAKIRPQAYGSLYKTVWRWFRQEKQSCALGAAFEAGNCPTITRTVPKGTVSSPFRGDGVAVKEDTEVGFIRHPDEWDEVYYHQTVCPQCEKSDTVVVLIPHLNDDHRWTREEIALWVERKENTLADVRYQAAVQMSSMEAQDYFQSLETPQEDEVLEAAEVG